jgi:meso-butanediol dehydrogenase/(S,S)-butanediol dehydrogenase/diacetyl reductase
MPGLEGKSVIVTGGGTGIGAATVRRLEAEGATVWAMGRRREPLASVCERVVVGDVTDADARERALAETGRLDLLVNNAGLDGEWDVVLDVNLSAPYRLARLAQPGLVERGGSIVNVSSVAGLVAGRGYAGYSASKAALLMLTKSLACELGPLGVRVNAVCPGWIQTPMGDRSMSDLGGDIDAGYAKVSGHIPLGRAGTPDEVAAAIAFLASPEASYVTAATLTVDGGSSVVDVATLALGEAWDP